MQYFSKKKINSTNRITNCKVINTLLYNRYLAIDVIKYI